MSLDSLLSPNAHDFPKTLREIWDSREDLREAYPDPNAPELIRWAAVNGVLEYPDRLAAGYPPLPPDDLRATACGGKTLQSHLWTGTEDLHALRRLWGIFADKPWDDIASVLDFGCACGRMTRWLPHVLPGAEIHGCDVRAAGPMWCAENLQGHYFANEADPPLELPDDSIDFVYSLSVFTHLNRTSALAWIRELARVCRPDGRILITTCGAFTLWVLTQSRENQQAIKIDEQLASSYLQRLAVDEFVFHPIPEASARHLGVEIEYGQTFLTERFVRDEWAEHVRVVGYVPASLSLFQDFLVLQPGRSTEAT